MNTGLQDAANLSWKLAAVLRGRAPDPEALLDSYQSERHPVGAMVLRSSGAIVRLAIPLPAPRAARSLAPLPEPVRPGRPAMGMISGIGISYSAPRGSHRLTGGAPPTSSSPTGGSTSLREGGFVLVAPAVPPPRAFIPRALEPPATDRHTERARPRSVPTATSPG